MASPWRDQLQKGSYKGVPFFIDSHEYTGGRRIVDHLFPYRDMAFTEDLGRRQRMFTMSMYVLGEDYFGDRDDLMEAFETEGAGILVHPYLGTKNVDAGEYTLNETAAEGGVARFQITFHETSRKVSADITIDVTDQVEAASLEVDESLFEEFADFDVSDLSLPNLNAAIAFVDAGSDAINGAASLIPQTDFGLSELAYSVRILKANTRDLIRKPFTLARYILDSAQLLASTLTPDRFLPEDKQGRVLFSPHAAVDALLGGIKKRNAVQPMVNYKSTLQPVEGQTQSKLKLAENQRLFGNLVTGSALGKLALVSTQTTYGTYAEAVAQREYLVAQIEAFLEDPKITDRTYQAFQDLLALTVQGIPGEQSQLNRLSYVTLHSPTPSLVLAYDLYEDLSLEQDIILRNKVKNPAFIPASVVEVIAGD